MDNKLFREVFPGLKLGKDLDDLIGQTTVEKITMFKSKKKMVISISSHNLIAKELIYKAEEMLSVIEAAYGCVASITKSKAVFESICVISAPGSRLGAPDAQWHNPTDRSAPPTMRM